MQESLLYDAHRQRVHRLQEKAESWQRDHYQALLVLEAEDMVQSALLAALEVPRIWSLAKKQLAQVAQQRLASLRDEIREFLDHTQMVLQIVLRSAEEIEHVIGRKLEGCAELVQALAANEDLRGRILASLFANNLAERTVNREQITAWRAEIARGEILNADDLLARMQTDAGLE